MSEEPTVQDLGEVRVIELIEEIIRDKMGKSPFYDDSFYFSLKREILKSSDMLDLVLNTDMLVSSTDVPKQMSPFHVGRKAILMNASDLIVKGVEPEGLILSLGLSDGMKINALRELLSGVLSSCETLGVEYLGGDLNQTKELILNPTMFGFARSRNIIHRSGLKEGDLLLANGRFGLTGVGFNILLERGAEPTAFQEYERSIKSVLEPRELGWEALTLSRERLATSSIDSSDGLLKSLHDLMRSNPGLGFQIDFDEQLIDPQAREYSLKHDASLEKLIFQAGEEFIHLFTVNPDHWDQAREAVGAGGGKLLKIGRVIPEEFVKILKEGESIELKGRGFEHFS